MSDFNATDFLRRHQLRATKPRIIVAEMLFGDGSHRHVTAEHVAKGLQARGYQMALATIYNTLHNFVDIGLLREIHGIEGSTIIFDTNTKPHHHFYNETTGELSDITEGGIGSVTLPEPPQGTETVGVDIVVRVR